ncbi:MAG: cupin domain-containing protein [Bacilli bacterium]|jgi:quercetin dioxygenase-like cupin family protein|nr:cupin domain-containing protein [Bacilli bacterium]
MKETKIIQNMEEKKAQSLKDLITVQAGSIVSKILFQNEAVSLTLFSFGEGQEISTHQSDGDALVQVLEGEGVFTIDGERHIVKEGESILMPHNHPHALKAEKDFKMLLTVVFA